MAVFVALDIVGARLDRRLQHRVGIAGRDGILDQAHAIEAGAEDVESGEELHEIWTSIDDLHGVARALEGALGEPESVGLAWRPQTSVEISGEDAEQLIKLVETLEEDDDIQTVWGNYEMSEEVMERLA